MWHITNITAENFISFKFLDLDISQGVCSLVYGLNEDNDKQKNNGTGKSSIIEAICFGLTGESLKGVTDGELINDHSDTANVMLTLENDYDDSMLEIWRYLDRKKPQRVVCHKYDANNKEIDTDNTVQPSVLEYNRFILDEIGLSKEDIYSNYVLSNNRYKSFFDASDKTKKAMINRFSGADAVDGSIEALRVDLVPMQEKCAEAHDKVVAADAKISAIESQIQDAENKRFDYDVNKQKRIAELDEKISNKRQQMREIVGKTVAATERLDCLKDLRTRVEQWSSDKDNEGLNTLYDRICDLFTKHNVPAIKNYLKATEESVQNIEHNTALITQYIVNAKSAKEAMVKIQGFYTKTKAEYEELKAKFDEDDRNDRLDLQDVRKDIVDIDTRIADIKQQIADNDKNLSSLNKQVRELKNTLYGVVHCPKCGYDFFIDEKASVDEIKAELASKTSEHERLEEIEKDLNNTISKHKEKRQGYLEEMDVIKADIQKRADKLELSQSNLRKVASELSQSENSVDEIANRIKNLEYFIEREQGKLDNLMCAMFDEALEKLDNVIWKGSNYIGSLNDEKSATIASIEVLENTRHEVETSSSDDLVKSLEESKRVYDNELQSCKTQYKKIKAECDKYVVQENYFNQFKSHLANRKVDAISAVTNGFLEKIGSDLRVELVGFRVLKTGKLRDKITVNLIRNGVPCGSYAKFSGGEKARVNLASILALQKLTNNACPEGKGLELIVLDEVLEAADSTGIESCCEALNKLRVTSLIITQNPIIDHNGNVVTVVKENGYSYIREDD